MYYLGVDGGGTKTQALLFDAANGAVRSLRLGPGNLCVLGEAGCVKLFADIARELLADVPISRIAGATFGFAGAGRDAQRQILESVAARMGFKNVHVLTDAQILHYAFFEGSPGILIAAGTGSICLVHSPQRPYHQIGGHGYLLGDLGSGFHIGKLAISHTLTRADAARDPSPLANALLDIYHADPAVGSLRHPDSDTVLWVISNSRKEEMTVRLQTIDGKRIVKSTLDAELHTLTLDGKQYVELTLASLQPALIEWQ